MKKDTKISMLVNEEQDIYRLNISGNYYKLVSTMLLAIEQVLNEFGINEKTNKKQLKDLCQTLGETLYQMVSGEGRNE